MRTKRFSLLMLVFVMLLMSGAAAQAAPEDDATATISIKNVTDLKIVIEVEICGDCWGLVSWGDGSVGYDIDLGSGGVPLEFYHTYAEAGCYTPSVYAFSYMDGTEVNVPLNPPVAVGDPTACDPIEPSGTLSLQGAGTEVFSASFNVDWEGGQADVDFGDGSSWNSGTSTSGNQDVENTYGTPGGVFRVSLKVGGVEQDFMCIGVSQGSAMEVACPDPPLVYNIYLPLALR